MRAEQIRRKFTSTGRDLSNGPIPRGVGELQLTSGRFLMKLKTKLTFFAAAIFTCGIFVNSTPVQAFDEERFYFRAAFSNSFIDIKGTTDIVGDFTGETTNLGYLARFGYSVNRNFSYEARLHLGAYAGNEVFLDYEDSGSAIFFGAPTRLDDVKLEQAYGGYLRFTGGDTGDTIRPYALLGFSYVKVDADVTSSSGCGFSYGIGVSIRDRYSDDNKPSGWFVEWVNHSKLDERFTINGSEVSGEVTVSSLFFGRVF